MAELSVAQTFVGPLRIVGPNLIVSLTRIVNPFFFLFEDREPESTDI